MNETQLQELIKQFNNAIPDSKWDDVRQAVITAIVDQMDLDTLVKIVEMNLEEYYTEHQDELITDLINYTNIDIATHLLDSLELDK